MSSSIKQQVVVLWLLLVRNAMVVDSFVVGSNRPQLKQPPGTFGDVDSTTRTTTSARRTTMRLSATTTRSIFHEYDGPIVLLGCSGPGNELTRLAAFLSTQRLSTATTTTTDDVVTTPQIVPFLPSSTTNTPDAWFDAISKKQYRWPDILLLDQSFLKTTSKTAEEQMQSMAQMLYEQCNCLSIYINTKSCPLSLEDKERYEQNVFVKYSDYEVCILNEGDDKDTEDNIDLSDDEEDDEDDDDDDILFDEWEHIEWELTRILARARLIPAIPGAKDRTVNGAHLTMGDNTFFLSLTFPHIELVEPYIPQMCQDVDAMEYRTDLLHARSNRFDIIYGMQLLRRYCRQYVVRVPALPFGRIVLEDVMPIVYTVRTQNQAGTYPDDEAGIKEMFQTLRWGLRGGVEVLDVESTWDPIQTSGLLDLAEQRYSSQILGSHHVVGKETTTEEAVELFLQCAMNGRAHGAKVVLSISDQEQDRMAYEAALIASELAASNGDPVIPHISLILGEIGQFSRIINIPFTPVTHETLPMAAAPGQLTANEIMTTRLLSKIFTPKKYAILGHNIAYSVSPQMHGAAFAATRLPHEYVRVDVATVEEFIESNLFKSDDFGGTSVTVPHKQAIIPYVDEMSFAAKAIGSVNTLIAKMDYTEDGFKRTIYGDNTDWKGIYNPLNRLLGGTANPLTDYVLIVGAGGTARAAAYAAMKLGLKAICYNRTPSKAQELARTFHGSVVTSLEQDGELGEVLREGLLRVVISTLPAASEFVLPDWLFAANNNKPIIFDVNYKPFSTKLLLQAEAAGSSVVRGSEMLWEQGVGQFELWTGRTAPYSVMKQVVLQNCVEDSTAIVAPADPSPTSVFE